MMKKLLFFTFTLLVLLPTTLLALEQVDYSQNNNWVIKENTPRANCNVDLFYVLPTIFAHKQQEYMQWHNNVELQKKALVIAQQHTSIFSPYTRVFAPYYRQREFRRVLKELAQSEEKITRKKIEIDDVKAAFRYYLKHLNNGRPFILFGFSQGAMTLLEVMKSELADPKVNSKLVAAYLIGYPKMAKTFPKYPHLRTAKGAGDTGVIICYNSQAPGKVKSFFTGKNEYYCINPINWRTDEKLATVKEHKGSCFLDWEKNKAIDALSFVQAQIDSSTGGLVVIPKKAGKYDSRSLGKGVYHMHDLNFFYYDLQSNGKVRIASFNKK
jgi:hypothetical protein